MRPRRQGPGGVVARARCGSPPAAGQTFATESGACPPAVTATAGRVCVAKSASSSGGLVRSLAEKRPRGRSFRAFAKWSRAPVEGLAAKAQECFMTPPEASARGALPAASSTVHPNGDSLGGCGKKGSGRYAGAVPGSFRAAVIPLGPRLHTSSSNLPRQRPGPALTPSIWSCSERLRACRVTAATGGLLPHVHLTRGIARAVCFRALLPGRPAGVTQLALRSPDFPPRAKGPRRQPVDSVSSYARWRVRQRGRAGAWPGRPVVVHVWKIVGNRGREERMRWCRAVRAVGSVGPGGGPD